MDDSNVIRTQKRLMASAPLVWRVPEVADRLEIGRSTAYELVACGEIPSVRIRGSIRVPVDALRAWLARKLKETNKAV